MNTQPIKPCPWCGRPGELDHFSDDPHYPDWQVLCTDPAIACRGAQPLEEGWRTPEEAVAAWDNRPIEAKR